MKYLKSTFLYAGVFLVGCSQPQQKKIAEKAEATIQPTSIQFDSTSSDKEAIRVADEVLNASGGIENWNNTKSISWTFFGKRHLVWNKHTGDVRIDFPDGEVNLLNLNTGEGRILKNGKEITNQQAVEELLKRAKSIWINDSYWLVLPFKLKDGGVTLKYFGNDMTKHGTEAEKIGLTFKEVGNTPNNKYFVWVDKSTKLISQWAFFKSADDAEPKFIMPWLDYEKHGDILLSGNRGNAQLTNIQVFGNLNENVFSSFDRPTFIRVGN